MLIALLTAAMAQTTTLPCADEPGAQAQYTLDYRAEKPDGTTAFERSYTLTAGVRDHDVLPVVMSTVSVNMVQAGEGASAAATRAIVEAPMPDVLAHIRFAQTGTEITFTNLPDVSTALRQSVRDAVVSSLPADAETERTGVIDELLDMVLSEEVIRASLNGYYMPVYGYTCQAWPIGQHDDNVAQPNPLGGEPLPATLTITVHPAAQDGSYRIEERQVVGDIDVASLVGPLIGQLGVPPDAIGPLLEMPVNIQNTTELVVDADGWLRSSSTHKTVELMGQRSTESTQLRRTPSP